MVASSAIVDDPSRGEVTSQYSPPLVSQRIQHSQAREAPLLSELRYCNPIRSVSNELCRVQRSDGADDLMYHCLNDSDVWVQIT